MLARQTSLVNGDPAVLIQKSDKHKVEVQERRNKSRDNQQTFLSLEKLLVNEVGDGYLQCDIQHCLHLVKEVQSTCR